MLTRLRCDECCVELVKSQITKAQEFEMWKTYSVVLFMCSMIYFSFDFFT